MRLKFIAIAGVVALCAASAGVAQLPAVPITQPQPFAQDGQNYRWAVANGVTGGLLLVRKVGTNTWRQEFGLGCSGTASGVMSAWSFEPKGATTQLRLRVEGGVFRARAGHEEQGGRRFVRGYGDLQSDFLRKLGASQTVTIEYGDRKDSFAAPGSDAVTIFEKYCRTLAQRASRDET